MASRIEYIGSPEVRQRQPRREDLAKLVFIRLLSCPICAGRPVDPMHLRAGNRLLGKRAVGVGEKPDDVWTIPGCRTHHDEQHGMNELEFWRSHNIEPFAFALALHVAYEADDLERALSIVAEHRHRAMGITI